MSEDANVVKSEELQEATEVKDSGDVADQKVTEPSDAVKNDGEESLIKPDDPLGVQKRINRAVRDRRNAERLAREEKERRESLESRLKDLEEKVKASPAQAQEEEVATPEEPQEEDFADFESYKKALKDYSRKFAEWTSGAAERAAKKAVAEERAERQKSEQERTAKEAESRHKQIVEEGKTKYADFEDVAFDPSVTEIYTDDMAVAVDSSPIFHDLAYYFGEHVDELERIAAIKSPVLRVREITRIESRLESELASKSNGQSPEKSGEKQITKAKDPINPVGGASGAGSRKWDDMSFSDYEKMRRKQIESAAR